MSGLAFTVLDERIAVRVNNEIALRHLLNVLKKYKLSWDQDDEPVELLYSLRIAPSETIRGRRNFHLLYLAAGQVSRTLDLSEHLKSFEESLWSVAALSSPQKPLLSGWAVDTAMGCVLLPVLRGEYMETLMEIEDLELKPFAKEFVPLSTQGQVQRFDGSSVEIVEILIPAPRGSKTSSPLKPSRALMELLQTTVSPPAEAMPTLSVLASSVPTVVGPVSNLIQIKSNQKT